MEYNDIIRKLSECASRQLPNTAIGYEAGQIDFRPLERILAAALDVPDCQEVVFYVRRSHDSGRYVVFSTFSLMNTRDDWTHPPAGDLT